MTLDPQALTVAARAIYDTLEGPVANQSFTRQVEQWDRSQELAIACISAYLTACWQDISTAPKDGREILLYGHGVLRSGGVYAKGQHVGWSQLARDGSTYWATRDPAVDCEPTHWMPLPEHPESSGRNRADATPSNPPSMEGR